MVQIDPVDDLRIAKALKAKKIISITTSQNNITDVENLEKNNTFTANATSDTIFILNATNNSMDVNFTVNFNVGSKKCAFYIVGRGYQKVKEKVNVFLANDNNNNIPQTLTITLPVLFLLCFEVTGNIADGNLDGFMNIKINSVTQNKGSVPATLAPRPAKLGPVPVKLNSTSNTNNYTIIFLIVIFFIISGIVGFYLHNQNNNNLST
jgi:hypothetical protein